MTTNNIKVPEYPVFVPSVPTDRTVIKVGISPRHRQQLFDLKPRRGVI